MNRAALPWLSPPLRSGGRCIVARSQLVLKTNITHLTTPARNHKERPARALHAATRPTWRTRPGGPEGGDIATCCAPSAVATSAGHPARQRPMFAPFPTPSTFSKTVATISTTRCACARSRRTRACSTTACCRSWIQAGHDGGWRRTSWGRHPISPATVIRPARADHAARRTEASFGDICTTLSRSHRSGQRLLLGSRAGAAYSAERVEQRLARSASSPQHSPPSIAVVAGSRCFHPICRGGIDMIALPTESRQCTLIV